MKTKATLYAPPYQHSFDKVKKTFVSTTSLNPISSPAAVDWARAAPLSRQDYNAVWGQVQHFVDYAACVIGV